MKKVLLVFGVVVSLAIWQYELVSYGYMQARGQLEVIMNAQPIDDLLEDPLFPDSLKTKLRLVSEIRQYSIDHLGINDADSYKTVFDQKGKTTLWNLTACEPFALEAKTWSFPLLGSFPYKGFFDLEKAKEERKALIDEGYDTRIRPVNGWSTLGWFDDPILSNMLSRPEGALAELIIHELTHGTLYIKDSAEYNENLATFIGEQGARQFLLSKYGSLSQELDEYIGREHDNEKYIDHFIRGGSLLDSLYGTMNASMTYDRKLGMKKALIQEIVNQLDTITFISNRNYSRRFAKTLPNNAFFMSFMRYHAKQGLFEHEFKVDHKSDIKSYLTYLKQKYPSL